MRLRQLGLEQYGNFAAQSLTLDPAPGRINLLVAPQRRRQVGAAPGDIRAAVRHPPENPDGQRGHLRPNAPARGGGVPRRRGDRLHAPQGAPEHALRPGRQPAPPPRCRTACRAPPSGSAWNGCSCSTRRNCGPAARRCWTPTATWRTRCCPAPETSAPPARWPRTWRSGAMRSPRYARAPARRSTRHARSSPPPACACGRRWCCRRRWPSMSASARRRSRRARTPSRNSPRPASSSPG